MSVVARRWWQRGAADHGWLRSFFTFSFANYYDPAFMSFSALRVINEDRVQPMTGFPTHPHSNAEIFSYILSGELTHKDSMGNIEVLKRGEVQFTSAGRGVRHSEYNNHPSQECHFLQIWYTPDAKNLPPKYYTIPQVSEEEKLDKFVTLIRDVKTFRTEERELSGLLPKHRAIPAHCSLTTRSCVLQPGSQVRHILGSDSDQKAGERWLYLHLAMTSGYKDPKTLESKMRKDIAAYQSHNDRLTRAARFCKRVYGVQPFSPLPQRSEKPRVTLTYAQSQDAKIAGPNKKMVALSSEASMIMTHSIRTMHEGILVGIGTLINDDPQLNTRLLNPLEDGKQITVEMLPRPIVLDGKLQTQLDCKLLVNAASKTGKPPLIITATDCDQFKADQLRKAGAEVVAIKPKDGLLPWTEVLQCIGKAGIRSVMIEGGATIIESLFTANEQVSLIDEIIVTVAPVKLGQDAVGYRGPGWLSRALNLPETGKEDSNALSQINLEPEIFHKDFVFAWSNRPESSEARIRVEGETLAEGDGIFLKKGVVGDEVVIENVGQQNAEFLLFDLSSGQADSSDGGDE